MEAHATSKRTRRGKPSKKRQELLAKKHSAHYVKIDKEIKEAKIPQGTQY
jgi:hypothetical protein